MRVWVRDLAATEVKGKVRDDQEVVGNSGPAESVWVSKAEEGDGEREGFTLETLVVLRAVGPPDSSKARVLAESGASGEVLRAGSVPAAPSLEGEGWAWAEVGLVTFPGLAVFLGVMRKGVPVIRGAVSLCVENVLEPDP